MAVGRVDALVQPLRDRHRPLGAEAELAARLLLERAGGERRGRVALGLALRDRLDDRSQAADGRGMALGGLAVADVDRLAVDPDEVRGEGGAAGRLEQRLERPVLAGRERADLPLALDDHADRDRLHAPRRQAAADLARQERAQRVADQPVDDAPRLLRVDEVLVDLARVRERVADRALGDLGEGDPAALALGDVGGLGHVPRDRLALAVEVAGQPDVVRAAGRLLDRRDLLAAVLGDDVLGQEVVVDVDAELALARVLGQVADVAVRREDLVVPAEVAFDRPRLGGRFHDHEMLGHGGAECSTGVLDSRSPAAQRARA